MTTLPEFLLSQIEADEAVARAATPGSWDGGERIVWSDVGPDPYVVTDGESGDGGTFSPENAEHIARHDPARVLAECKAKRDVIRIVSLMGGYCNPDTARQVPTTLRALVQPYADHPDFDAGWFG